MEKYKEWIYKEYPKFNDALGKCKEAVDKMVKAFPELKATNGYVHFLSYEPRAHWWCIDSKNNIIDPTAHQFLEYMGEPIFEYEEISDDHPARNYEQAKCMNCGEYYFVTPELHSTMHNKKCEKEFISYLNGEINE